MSAKTKVVEALFERVQGQQVSRAKAVLVAVGAAAVVYRVLRSGGGEEEQGGGEEEQGDEQGSNGDDQGDGTD
jgi:hypothetical protein